MLTTFTTRQTQINDTPRNKIRKQLDNETKINKNNNNTILQLNMIHLWKKFK